MLYYSYGVAAFLIFFIEEQFCNNPMEGQCCNIPM